MDRETKSVGTEQSKKPLIILTGPTAAGKTSLSIQLARRIGGEIISADSMQIYRRMDIGTAKITLEEMQGIPHYLVDEMEPTEECNVVEFQKRAKAAMERIYANGHIPIVVGGTGFYIQALLYDIDFSEHEEKESYRQELVRIGQERGNEYLHAMLQEVDPEYAASVHSNNVKRVIRALEYYHETGQKLSSHNEEQREKTSPYRFAYFVLNMDRKILYERVNHRVDQMLAGGLTEEVKGLVETGCTREMVSMQGIGYREYFDYFEGKCTLEEVAENIKKDTRHFAKRQLTWFRRERDVLWLEKGKDISEEAILEQMMEILEEKKYLSWKITEKY